MNRSTWGGALLFAGSFVAIAGLDSAAYAHESRPAYLELKETSPDQFEVVWRTPVSERIRLPVAFVLPPSAKEVKPRTVLDFPDAHVEKRWVDSGPAGLADEQIRFDGLASTSTDVLVRVQMLDGRISTTIVRASQPWLIVSARQSTWALATEYVVEGIRHILFGADHLLFVLGLLLIVKDWWMLFKTVTAFTVAHSITLAVATLGYASAPPLPLNAAIALSILFLAPEIVRIWRGQTSFTIRHPWVVAFIFGLIHGFGFASALTSAGLARSDLPLALLSFNIGVELGQCGIIVLILLLERSFRQLQIHWPRLIQVLPAYTIGTLGAFWTIQRTFILLGLLQ